MPADSVYKRFWVPIHIKPYGEDTYRKALLPPQSKDVLKALLELGRQQDSRDIYATDVEISKSIGMSNSSAGDALKYLQRIGFITLIDRKSMRSIHLERTLASINLARFSPAARAILELLYQRADRNGKVFIAATEIASLTGLEEPTVQKELWKMRSTDLLTDKPKAATKRYRLEVRRGVGPNFYLYQLEPLGVRADLEPTYDDNVAV